MTGKERTDDPVGGVFSRTILDRVKQTQPSHVFLFSHGWKGDVPVSDRAIQPLDRRDVEAGDRSQGAWDRRSVRCSSGCTGQACRGAKKRSPPRSPSPPRAHPSLRRSSTRRSRISAAAMPSDSRSKSSSRLRAGSGRTRAARRCRSQAYAATRRGHRLLRWRGSRSARRMRRGRRSIRRRPSAPNGQPASASRSASSATSRNGILAGLRQASFWPMKHRARTIGEQGMHTFVADLQRASRCQRPSHGPQLRLHRRLVDPRRAKGQRDARRAR